MTILAGMVGADGVLLAADQRGVRLAQHEGEFDDYLGIRKIVLTEPPWMTHMAYAGVGDEFTRAVGARLADALEAGAFESLDAGRALARLAAAAVTAEIAALPDPEAFDNTENRSLLIVFYGPHIAEPQLWYLQIRCPPVYTERVYGAKVSGAIGNRARFFDRYYAPNTPLGNLIFLAAHIVLSANQFDPAMIEGLDVALFREEGAHFINEHEKGKLRERSEKLDALIRDGLKG